MKNKRALYETGAYIASFSSGAFMGKVIISALKETDGFFKKMFVSIGGVCVFLIASDYMGAWIPNKINCLLEKDESEKSKFDVLEED